MTYFRKEGEKEGQSGLPAARVSQTPAENMPIGHGAIFWGSMS